MQIFIKPREHFFLIYIKRKDWFKQLLLMGEMHIKSVNIWKDIN